MKEKEQTTAYKLALLNVVIICVLMYNKENNQQCFTLYIVGCL